MACCKAGQLAAPLGRPPAGNWVAGGGATDVLQPETKTARPDGTCEGNFDRRQDSGRKERSSWKENPRPPDPAGFALSSPIGGRKVQTHLFSPYSSFQPIQSSKAQFGGASP